MGNEIWITVVLTIVGLVAVRFLVALVMCGGDMHRLRVGIKSSIRILRDPAMAKQVEEMMTAAPKEQKPPKPSGAPLRMLILLQREGRLLDFLLEDIQTYGNEQIGAAVRDIHRQCQHALKEHLVLAPVLPQTEGATVEVPSGFDPSAVRLTGNVTGQPPFRGNLTHHGWRVAEMKLPTPPEGQDEFIIQPAEVELP